MMHLTVELLGKPQLENWQNKGPNKYKSRKIVCIYCYSINIMLKLIWKNDLIWLPSITVRIPTSIMSYHNNKIASAYWWFSIDLPRYICWKMGFASIKAYSCVSLNKDKNTLTLNFFHYKIYKPNNYQPNGYFILLESLLYHGVRMTEMTR